MIEDIGELRRTKFSRDITTKLAGKKVVLMGWVHELRDLGGVKFFLLRDREGMVQVTFKKGVTSPELLEKFKRLGKEFVVGVKGMVKANKMAPGGREVMPSDVLILNTSDLQLPLDVTGKVPAELDTRLNARAIDLRRPTVLAIFRIRDQIFTAIRDFLENEGFIEVHTPKIVKSGAEGGATLFPISYFEQEAFLSQSPQLYKEVLTSCFDRVYEIAPLFRAEPSDTARHISEFTGVDLEMAFADENDAMGVLEDMFYYMVSHVKKRCDGELELIGRDLKVPKPPYKRLTYDKALERLDRLGHTIEWGEDIDREAERLLGIEMKHPFFIKEYPTKMKPFYIMPIEGNEVCRSFDFDFGHIELASGGMRVHDKDMLIENLKAHGQEPGAFKHHLNAFGWGMPPHAGWGLGGDRLVMTITGVQNVRECIAFPRDIKRLTP